MNKLWKILAAFIVCMIGALTLVSCGKYNFYKDWHDAGAEIEKENIYTSISLDEAKGMKEQNKTFVLLLGTSKSSKGVDTISLLQSEAEYFGFKGKLYYADASDRLKLNEDRQALKKEFGIYDAAAISTNIVVVCYNNGQAVLDTSKKYDDSTIENFITGTVVDYYKVASYLFNDFKYAE